VKKSTDIGLPDDPTAADLPNIRSKIKLILFVDVICCDKRSPSGNVYPKKVMWAALKRFSAKHQGGYFPIRSANSKDEMTGIVGMGNARIVGDMVQVRCVGFLPHMEEAFKQGTLSLSISGIGSVNDGIVQPNYELTNFFAVSDPVSGCIR